jgi:type 1 fimbriae regulatory protein FimB/type 1 fimbriae regulatory protein FimE
MDCAAGTANGTIPPRRRKNAEVRKREWLTDEEVATLRKHAGHRDSTMILLAVRHGLRVSELVSLEWEHVVDLHVAARACLKVERLKGSVSGLHPLEPDEVAALRKLRKESEPGAVYLFTGRDGKPLTPAAFRKMLSRVADAAGLARLKVHPHALRHTCGHLLVSEMPLGMLADWMGHANIQNTRGYSRADAEQFRGVWRARGRRKVR